MNVLDKKWVHVVKGTELARELRIEDDSIFTIDKEEVIGCSEWMRDAEGAFEHIVSLHNASLGE